MHAGKDVSVYSKRKRLEKRRRFGLPASLHDQFIERAVVWQERLEKTVLDFMASMPEQVILSTFWLDLAITGYSISQPS